MVKQGSSSLLPRDAEIAVLQRIFGVCEMSGEPPAPRRQTKAFYGHSQYAMSQSEVARALGCTQQQVQLIESRALGKLTDWVLTHWDEVEPFLD